MFSRKVFYQIIAHIFHQGCTRKHRNKQKRLEGFDNSSGSTAAVSVEIQLDLNNNKEIELYKTIQDIPIPSPHVQSQIQMPWIVLSTRRRI